MKKDRNFRLGTIISTMVCLLASCSNAQNFCPNVSGFSCLNTSEIDELFISAQFLERHYIKLEKKRDIRKFLRETLDFYRWDENTFPYETTILIGNSSASFDIDYYPSIWIHEEGLFGRGISVVVDDEGIVYLVNIGRGNITLYSEKGLGNIEAIYKSYEVYPWY